MALTDFQLPGGESLRARKSAVRSIFIRALIPGITPSNEDYATALKILGQKPGKPLQCSYCGDAASEWDHFYPVMHQGLPTGYLTVIQNLVPACGKCNQSKGNSQWREWMLGDAPQSPKSRGVRRLKRRVKRLECYDEWGGELQIDLEDELSSRLMQRHFSRLETVLDLMDEADREAKELRDGLRERLPDVLPAPRRRSWWRRLLGL